ncbi:MAG: N-acetyltransferase, partial [Mesorhizobium sp.]
MSNITIRPAASTDLDRITDIYAYAGPFRPRPAYRFIVEDSVYVAPEAKGHGIGLKLMQGLIEAAEAAGFRQIIAVIGDGRPDSASVRSTVA